jgi:peptidyl-dipeptidase Dcp
MEKVEETEAPKLAAHEDTIFLNPKLFARVKAIYDARESLHLDTEALQLVKVYYQQFVHAGANLSDPDKTKLRALNEQLSTLETAFEQKLLAATKAGALVVDDKAELAGLSDSAIAAAAHAAESRKPHGQMGHAAAEHDAAALAGLAERPRHARTAVRQFAGRAPRKATATIRATPSRTLASCARRRPAARLSQLCRLCAGRPDGEHARQGETFMAQLVPRHGAKAAERGEGYPGRHRQERPAFRAQALGLGASIPSRCARRSTISTRAKIKPYFELNNVLQNGVFYAANQLYGITFKERKDLPVYQPDVRVFEVFDKDGRRWA